MKPREQGGVLDPRLNVYGTQSLKVAGICSVLSEMEDMSLTGIWLLDCSIAPANVGANPYNTAVAIGEKAAVIIAEDLGISGI